jgi:hypothetical protein
VELKSIGVLETRVDEDVFDVDVPVDVAVLVFWVVRSTLVDLASVFAAFAPVFANFVSPFVYLADLRVDSVACVPFCLAVEPFACAPVVFTVETFGAEPVMVAPLGAPVLGACVFMVVGLGAFTGFAVFGPASAPTASASPSTTRIVKRRMVWPPVRT